MNSDHDLHKGGVSPFGNLRINDRSHLPAAYRSVPRPSSPLGAKASTERPSFTHHLTARTQYQHAPLPQELIAPKEKKHAPTPPSGSRHLLLTKPSSIFKEHEKPLRPEGLPSAARPVSRRRRSTGRSKHPLARPPGHNPEPVPCGLETVGIEPTTPCLQSRRSPTELRPHKPTT